MVRLLKLLIAGGNGTVLLEPIDQAFDAVALAVGGPVEADPAPRLGCAARDDRADPPPAQIGAHRLPGVALVGDHPIGAQAGASPAGAGHRPALQQRRHLRRLMPLPGGQDSADRLAAAFGAQMDFGREPAPGAPEGLITAPFLAPAAC